MTYYGVRFTPTQPNAKVTGAKIYTATMSGAGACSAMVYTGKDMGGYVLPDVRKDKATFTPSSAGWVNVNFSTQPVISSGDFFVFVTSGYNPNVAIAVDNSMNYQDRQYGSDYMTDDWYYMAVPGDFLIHAIVTYIGVEEKNAAGKTELKAMPNPILSRGNISYTLKAKSEISLNIYDASGKLVRTLEEGVFEAGTRTVNWDTRSNNGREVSAGKYFCKLRIGNESVLTKTLTVL